MNYDIGGRAYAVQAGLQDRISFIRSVYLWLMGGFAMAGLAAMGAWVATPFWAPLLHASPQIFMLVLFLAQMGSIVFAQAVSRRRPLNMVAYALFTGISGFIAGMVSIMFASVIGPGVVLAAAGMTAGDFLVLTVVTFVSKKDFSFLRNFVLIGIGVMFFGGLIAWIFKLEVFSLVISAVAVVACSAKILYDTSAMLRTRDFSDPAGFALSLFVSLYNIFLSLLRLLGGRRN
ncbi:MAG TPA: Bax inhibitor-1 family protein [Holophaga sp.]|nr:Bax inhibitor-1 family protein [Holophaga sp.]